ncbi:MAG: hypothetical protein ACE147_04865 [Candidatus Methylomirabilales bacterium]
MRDIRRIGLPRQVAITPEEFCRCEVPLSEWPPDNWVRLFEASPPRAGGGASAPPGRVVGSRIVFDCPEEDVFRRLRAIDARIARTNALLRERASGPAGRLAPAPRRARGWTAITGDGRNGGSAAGWRARPRRSEWRPTG